jgi:hypothetical protein
MIVVNTGWFWLKPGEYFVAGNTSAGRRGPTTPQEVIRQIVHIRMQQRHKVHSCYPSGSRRTEWDDIEIQAVAPLKVSDR